MTQYNIAVLGATGAVGQELLSILVELKFPCFPALACPPRSAGRKVQVGGRTMWWRLWRQMRFKE